MPVTGAGSALSAVLGLGAGAAIHLAAGAPLELAVGVGLGSALLLVAGQAMIPGTPELKESRSEGQKAAKRAAKKAQKEDANRKASAAFQALKAKEEAEEQVKAERARAAAEAKAAAEAAAAAKAKAKADAEAEKAKADKKKKKKGGATPAPAPAPAPVPVTPVAVPAPAADKKKKKKSKAAAGEEKKAETKKAETPAAAAASAPSAATAQDSDEAGWETQKPRARKPKAAATPAAAAAADGEGKAQPTLQAVELKIKADLHGRIIGSGGAYLSAIQNETGAKINMPRKDEASSVIKITGSAEAVERATRYVEELAETGISAVTHPGTYSGDLKVESKHHAILIGPAGAHIKAIQTKTNTKIVMPDKKTGQERVAIQGTKENIKVAKAAIKSLIAEGYSPLTHEGWIRVEVPVALSMLSRLIGTKGQTVKSIQGNSKARIRIPDSKEPIVNVVVTGLPDHVAQAQKEMNTVLTPPEEEPVEEDPQWADVDPIDDSEW